MLSVVQALSAISRHLVLILKRLISKIGLQKLWPLLISIYGRLSSWGVINGKGEQREDAVFSSDVATHARETTTSCSRSPDGYLLDSLGRPSGSHSQLPSAPPDLTPITVPETGRSTEGSSASIIELVQGPLEVGPPADHAEFHGTQTNGQLGKDSHLHLKTTHPTQLKRYDREVNL